MKYAKVPHWSDVVNILSQQEIGCGGHLVFQKLLKINTSQAYATLYPYETFGEDIFITFPLIDRTSSIFWVSKKWLWRPSCFSKIAENQYQPSYWHHRHAKKNCERLTPHASRLTPHASRLTPHASRLTPHAAREHKQKLYVPPFGGHN